MRLCFQFCFFVFNLILSNSFGSETPTLMVQRLSKAQFEFSVNLYSQLAKQSKENICFSPYSLASLLTMLYFGAEDNSRTEDQLKNVLNLNGLSQFEISNTTKFISHELSTPFYQKFSGMANGLLLDSSVLINHPYLEKVRKLFKADVFQIDFRNRMNLSGDLLHRWVKNQTKLDFGLKLVTRNPKLVLLNVASLESKWLFPFNEFMTFEKGLFYVSSKERLEVPLMTGRFYLPLGYSVDLECRVVELPFVSRRVSLFILLPDDMEGGLERLEASLNVETVKTLLSTLKDENVNIRLPRIKLDVEVKMIDALRELGLTNIFDDYGANFKEINPNDHLHVSEIFHRTVIRIHESSPESGNSLDMSNHIGAFGDKYFEVDHPFIFLVWDYPTGTALYLGRVVQPDIT